MSRSPISFASCLYERSSYAPGASRYWARISFEAGEAWDAETGAGAKGEDAFYDILRFKRGRFELEVRAAPARRSIETPTINLLIEAMRRRDDAADRTPEA